MRFPENRLACSSPVASHTQRIDSHHRAALQWFSDQAGQEVAWPAPLEGLFLVNKAKGIHKPAGLRYALSIRQSLSGPYEDALRWAADGSWYLDYAYEGSDPNYFTNTAMRACLDDGIPVGVLIQVKGKPNPRYKVLGLGNVYEDSGRSFSVHQSGSESTRAASAVDVAVKLTDFDATNAQDARAKAIRAIAVRRGQPAFRRALFTAYGGQCAISGSAVAPVLEAAHVIAYLGDHTNHVQNGILLRGDLHTLFDLGLLSIDPDSMVVRCAPSLEGSEYWAFNGRKISLPAAQDQWPSRDALRRRAQEFQRT